MHVVAWVWQFVLLPVVLVAGVGTVVAAVRGGPRELSFSARDWLFVGLLVFAAGDAVFGSGRPAGERLAKGAAVVLFGSALAITLCRRRLRRKTDQVSVDEP